MEKLSEAYILYLQYLRLLCPGYHKIRVTVDKASMHMSQDVLDRIKSSNLPEKPAIICDFIEAGMTSVYQPPDVVVNKHLKDALKKAYGNYRNETATDFEPGKHIDKTTIEKTFIANLDNLSLTSAYKALIDHHTTLDLTSKH